MFQIPGKKPQQNPIGEQSKKNAADKLLNQQWKSQEDYKRMIIQLQLQNEKYRNELYQLGETVNKILDKTKLPQSNKINAPNLESQLQLVKKQLHNVNQFIEIYQKQLNQLNNKKKNDQNGNLIESQDTLKAKTQQLSNLKRQVKDLTHKNRALEYKLLEYNRKNKAKSQDQQALQLKQLLNQNKNLKTKLQQLTQMQQKKQQWLKKNMESAKNLQLKIQQQQTKFPKISRGSSRDKLTSSLPKLQSQKKIYQKWLESSKGKNNTRLEKQIQDLQKINKMVQEKIQTTTKQIKQIQDNIAKLKEKVQSNQEEFLNETVQDNQVKKKQYGCNVTKRVRKIRRDWVGKFDSLRFSDSRTVREEARIYRVLYNSSGYYQFSYYSTKDYKRIFVGKLPFDTSTLLNGKQSTFTVEKPDFIKYIKLKINLKTQRVMEMHFTSNLGVKGQFISDQVAKNTQSKPNTSNKQEQVQIYYDIDVKANQAITSLFGSYGVKYDQKKNVVAVWLEGLGAQMIQDFVQELI